MAIVSGWLKSHEFSLFQSEPECDRRGRLVVEALRLHERSHSLYLRIGFGEPLQDNPCDTSRQPAVVRT